MASQAVNIRAIGGYRYKNGAKYIGSWNTNGLKQNEGHLLLPDGTRYDGCFNENGLFDGQGVLAFADGARYEGEFHNGWFHGYGIFWRNDGMRYEGEFRGGKICGYGLTTFNDNTNGFPRNEGFFKECVLVKRENCPEIIQRAKKIAYMARNKFANYCD